jgi:hypothetical protein
MGDATYQPKTYRDKGGDRFVIAPGGILRIEGELQGFIDAGQKIFCDPANGDDTNTGLSPFDAVQTLTAALALAVAGKNDTIYLIGDGSTTATARLSATLVWNKNATHLIGITAPTMEAQRCRISHETTETTNINPLMQVTAAGCIFANFSFYQGVGQATTDEQLIEVTGDRNYFYNVHFGGMGHATGAARAGSYLIKFTDGDENTFERCAIGLETIQRSAANASVLIRGGSQRNRFIDCEFPMAASETSPLWVDVNDSNALNGSTLIFRRCMFRNLLNISGAATPAVVAVVAADANGTVYFDQCSAQATKWAAASTRVQVAGGFTPEGFNTGLFDQARDS